MMFESIETECYQSLIINIYFRINKYKKKTAGEQFNWQTK